MTRLEQIQERVVQRVAELGDRTSPDDWPEAMIVTAEELCAILTDELASQEAEIAHLREALTCALEERPMANGEYPHLLYCNGPRNVPAGTRGVTCNCKCGNARVGELETEIAALKGRRFPIMNGPSIPWLLMAPHERQALRNHGGQTLERLAERGGLSPCEAIAVLEDREWQPINHQIARQRLADLASSSPQPAQK